MRAELAERLEARRPEIETAGVEYKVNGGPAEACEAEYPEGAELALVALAKAGSTFASYSAGTGSATGCSTSPCAFTVEADSEPGPGSTETV